MSESVFRGSGGADERPSKSPKIHPKNQRFFGDPGKGDFGFSPFKGEIEGVFCSEKADEY